MGCWGMFVGRKVSKQQLNLTVGDLISRREQKDPAIMIQAKLQVLNPRRIKKKKRKINAHARRDGKRWRMCIKML